LPGAEAVSSFEIIDNTIRCMDILNLVVRSVFGEKRLHRTVLEGAIRKEPSWADEDIPDQFAELVLFGFGDNSARARE
jgi:hypothetical protein